MCVFALTGICMNLQKRFKLEKNKKHNIEIIVDRLMVKEGIEKRLTDSIENVLKLSRGTFDSRCCWRGTDDIFSQSFSCPDCGISIDEIEPTKLFFQ